MKRIILSVLIAVLTAASGHAQGLSSGTKALRTASKTASSTSGKVMRQLEQQSRRAEQAARAAAAAARLNVKPMGVPIVIPNPDSDDQKQKKGGKIGLIRPLPKIKPFPKIKTFSEMMDDLIAARYDSIKSQIENGVYIPIPYDYFQLADYAMRHNDEPFAITCLERVRVDRLTPRILELVGRRYVALHPFMPEIARSVVVSAYTKMIDAKLQGVDCDSARMQQGDTLLMVTRKFNPSLNPLVELSCNYDSSKEVERYKASADSVIATYDKWMIPAFKDTFARHFLITLIDNGESAAALDYFGRTPLKEFPESRVAFALNLANCAIAEQNDTLFSAYLQKAVALDSVAAEQYWADLYDANWKAYLADPSQQELADWLIETSPEPANNAFLLSLDLFVRLNDPDEATWEWEDIADYTPEQTTIRAAMLHIIDKGLAVDEGLSSPDAVEWCQYLKAEMLLPDPTTLEEGKAMLNVLVESDNIELRSLAIIGVVYIAAHGLDKPKDGLKILKKNLKLLDEPAVNSEIRNIWYDYMAALATRLGKTKDADKYLKLKETTKN